MGVASLGTLPHTSSNTSSNAAPVTTCATVDLEGAQWHFEQARAMLEKMREDQVAQQGVRAEVCNLCKYGC